MPGRDYHVVRARIEHPAPPHVGGGGDGVASCGAHRRAREHRGRVHQKRRGRLLRPELPLGRLRRRDDWKRLACSRSARVPADRAVDGPRCRRGRSRFVTRPPLPRCLTGWSSARARSAGAAPSTCPRRCPSPPRHQPRPPRRPDGQGAAPGHGVHRVVDEATRASALEGVSLDGRAPPFLGHRDDGALGSPRRPAARVSSRPSDDAAGPPP